MYFHYQWYGTHGWRRHERFLILGTMNIPTWSVWKLDMFLLLSSYYLAPFMKHQKYYKSCETGGTTDLLIPVWSSSYSITLKSKPLFKMSFINYKSNTFVEEKMERWLPVRTGVVWENDSIFVACNEQWLFVRNVFFFSNTLFSLHNMVMFW